MRLWSKRAGGLFIIKYINAHAVRPVMRKRPVKSQPQPQLLNGHKFMYYAHMWYVLFFLLNLQTGKTVFSVYKLPLQTKEQCEAIASSLKLNYPQEVVAKQGCVYIEDADGI